MQNKYFTDPGVYECETVKKREKSVEDLLLEIMRVHLRATY